MPWISKAKTGTSWDKVSDSYGSQRIAFSDRENTASKGSERHWPFEERGDPDIQAIEGHLPRAPEPSK